MSDNAYMQLKYFTESMCIEKGFAKVNIPGYDFYLIPKEYKDIIDITDTMLCNVVIDYKYPGIPSYILVKSYISSFESCGTIAVAGKEFFSVGIVPVDSRNKGQIYGYTAYVNHVNNGTMLLNKLATTGDINVPGPGGIIINKEAKNIREFDKRNSFTYFAYSLITCEMGSEGESGWSGFCICKGSSVQEVIDDYNRQTGFKVKSGQIHIIEDGVSMPMKFSAHDYFTFYFIRLKETVYGHAGQIEISFPYIKHKD